MIARFPLAQAPPISALGPAERRGARTPRPTGVGVERDHPAAAARCRPGGPETPGRCRRSSRATGSARTEVSEPSRIDLPVCAGVAPRLERRVAVRWDHESGARSRRRSCSVRAAAGDWRGGVEREV